MCRLPPKSTKTHLKKIHRIQTNVPSKDFCCFQSQGFGSKWSAGLRSTKINQLFFRNPAATRENYKPRHTHLLCPYYIPPTVCCTGCTVLHTAVYTTYYSTPTYCSIYWSSNNHWLIILNNRLIRQKAQEFAAFLFISINWIMYCEKVPVCAVYWYL